MLQCGDAPHFGEFLHEVSGAFSNIRRLMTIAVLLGRKGNLSPCKNESIRRIRPANKRVVMVRNGD
jgi:hypothetical protein